MTCEPTFSLSQFLPAEVEIGLISGPIPEIASSLGGFVLVKIGMRVVSLCDEHGVVTEWVWFDCSGYNSEELNLFLDVLSRVRTCGFPYALNAEYR